MESKLKRSPVKGMLSMFKPGGGGNSAGLAALPPSTLHRSRTNSSGGSVKDGDEMRADYETKITGLTAQIVAAKSAQQRAMDENKFLMGALVQVRALQCVSAARQCSASRWRKAAICSFLTVNTL